MLNYHDTQGFFPPGYIDRNLNPVSTPDNDLGPSWGWASFLLPYMEQGAIYNQINFNQTVGTGSNTTISQQALPFYQCPTDPLQDAFVVYDPTLTTILATVAHGNYVGCSGWEECFNNAGGAAIGQGADGLVGGFGLQGRPFLSQQSVSRGRHHGWTERDDHCR